MKQREKQHVEGMTEKKIEDTHCIYGADTQNHEVLPFVERIEGGSGRLAETVQSQKAPRELKGRMN